MKTFHLFVKLIYLPRPSGQPLCVNHLQQLCRRLGITQSPMMIAQLNPEFLAQIPQPV